MRVRRVVGFRRRHVGASIQEAWTMSLDSIRSALDANLARDRLILLRPRPRSLGQTREAFEDGRFTLDRTASRLLTTVLIKGRPD